MKNLSKSQKIILSMFIALAIIDIMLFILMAYVASYAIIIDKNIVIACGMFIICTLPLYGFFIDLIKGEDIKRKSISDLE